MITQLLVFVGILVIVGLAASVRVVKQYERGVVFRFGRLQGQPREPGLRLIVPAVDRMQKVNLQIVTMPVPGQEGITRDNVTVRVDAVIYFNVTDPTRAVINVENYLYAMGQVAQTSLRSIIGKTDLDDLLSNREQLNQGLELMIDSPALSWGINIDRVEIKDVSLPETMKRSIARQAEAERERRSRIISADGEYQASRKLSEAAGVMSDNPSALQLRLLETVVEVSAEKNSTLVLPFPVELLQFVDTLHSKGQDTAGDQKTAAQQDSSAPEPSQREHSQQAAGQHENTSEPETAEHELPEQQDRQPSDELEHPGATPEPDRATDEAAEAANPGERADPVSGGLTAIPPRPRLPGESESEEDSHVVRTPYGLA